MPTPIVNNYTYEEARNCVYRTFFECWRDPVQGFAGINGLDGREPEVRFENIQYETDPPTDFPWLRMFVRHVTADFDSFGIDGEGVYEAQGILTVQVFVPIDQDGLLLADRIARVIARAFRGERGPGECCGILFRRARVNEQGPTDRWFQYNVLAEFEYDEDDS